MKDDYDFTIDQLGPCKVRSPIELSTKHGDFRANYVRDDSYVRYKVNVFADEAPSDGLDKSNLMQKAGPREYIYFNPAHVTAGICTCGGLCPGLNDVIRAVVRCLYYRYGVKKIRGFRFGFKGFFPESGFDTIDLTPENVDDIHKIGGSFLGTSRGGGNRVSDIVDAVESLNSICSLSSAVTELSAVPSTLQTKLKNADLKLPLWEFQKLLITTFCSSTAHLALKQPFSVPQKPLLQFTWKHSVRLTVSAL